MYGSIFMLASGFTATYCPYKRCVLISVSLAMGAFMALITSMWLMLAAAQKLVSDISKFFFCISI
jgi:hypothetical protein